MRDLIKLYTSTLKVGKLSEGSGSTALPDVHLAQQSYVRYCGVDKAVQCDAWRKADDPVASRSDSREPSADSISLTIDRVPVDWILPVFCEQKLAFRVSVTVRASRNVCVPLAVCPYILTPPELEKLALWQHDAQKQYKRPQYLSKDDAAVHEITVGDSGVAHKQFNFGQVQFALSSFPTTVHVLFQVLLPSRSTIFCLFVLPTIAISSLTQRASALENLRAKVPVITDYLEREKSRLAGVACSNAPAAPTSGPAYQAHNLVPTSYSRSQMPVQQAQPLGSVVQDRAAWSASSMPGYGMQSQSQSRKLPSMERNQAGGAAQFYDSRSDSHQASDTGRLLGSTGLSRELGKASLSSGGPNLASLFGARPSDKDRDSGKRRLADLADELSARCEMLKETMSALASVCVSEYANQLKNVTFFSHLENLRGQNDLVERELGALDAGTFVLIPQQAGFDVMVSRGNNLPVHTTTLYIDQIIDSDLPTLLMRQVPQAQALLHGDTLRPVPVIEVIRTLRYLTFQTTPAMRDLKARSSELKEQLQALQLAAQARARNSSGDLGKYKQAGPAFASGGHPSSNDLSRARLLNAYAQQQQQQQQQQSRWQQQQRPQPQQSASPALRQQKGAAGSEGAVIDLVGDATTPAPSPSASSAPLLSNPMLNLAARLSGQQDVGSGAGLVQGSARDPRSLQMPANVPGHALHRSLPEPLQRDARDVLNNYTPDAIELGAVYEAARAHAAARQSAGAMSARAPKRAKMDDSGYVTSPAVLSASQLLLQQLPGSGSGRCSGPPHGSTLPASPITDEAAAYAFHALQDGRGTKHGSREESLAVLRNGMDLLGDAIGQSAGASSQDAAVYKTAVGPCLVADEERAVLQEALQAEIFEWAPRTGPFAAFTEKFVGHIVAQERGLQGAVRS